MHASRVRTGVSWATAAGLLAAAVLLWTAPPADAQAFRFGKNRVQYETRTWLHLPSERVDVYAYEPGGHVLATLTARAAEEALADVEALFGHTLGGRLTVIVYQGHAAFAATNVVDLPVHAEGIGGVTEGARNRIVLPFTGDRRAFRRVLHHEIVHAVTNDFFYGSPLQRVIRTGGGLRLPLWFAEGLAEYAAAGWDAASDAYVRDALLHDRLPPIEGLAGFLAYRGGQGVFDFLAAEYGREAITELLHRTRALGSVEAAVEETFGVPLAILSERWHAALRTVHFPEVAAREDADAVLRPLLPPSERAFHAAAAIAPQGDRVAFLSARRGLFDVVLVGTVGEARPRRLVAGQRSPAFERFPVLSPGIAWSPDGTRLAVAVRAGPTEAVAFVDAETGRARHLRLPDLDGVLAVAWSPDGTRLALSATRGAQANLYLVDVASGALTPLTEDGFADLEPAWSPDGRFLVFHSDRGDHLETRGAAPGLTTAELAPFALYRLDLHDPRRVERLTRPLGWDDRSAVFGGDPDRLLFVSDRNGVPNLYSLTLSTGVTQALTDLAVGVERVSLSADGQRAAVTALRGGVPQVHLLLDPFERARPQPPAPTVWLHRVGRAQGTAPALAVAHPATAEQNPFLREAHAPPPVAADPLHRPSACGDRPAPTLSTGSLAGAGDGAPSGTALGSPACPPATLPAPRPYRLRFAPDFVYGDLGFDAVFGIQSFVQASFSDLLGNHRLTATTNLVVDLRNADYLLSYAYLPRRTAYALTVFHVARQLTDLDRRTVLRYRNYGVVGTATHPIDTFRRVEAELSLQGVSLTDLVDLGARPRERAFVLPALTLTQDVTVPGPAGPVGGHRMAVRLAATPGPAVAFASALADARVYTGGPAGSLALRLATGLTLGRDRPRFYTAGVQNWINPTFAGTPIRDERDFALGTPVFPLRGHAVDAASGSRFVLANAEARVPLAAALRAGALPPLPLARLQAVAFVDVGALTDGPFRLWRNDPDGAGPRTFEDLRVGVGGGVRWQFLGYPFRLDAARPFDGRRLGPTRLLLSVGRDL